MAGIEPGVGETTRFIRLLPSLLLAVTAPVPRGQREAWLRLSLGRGGGSRKASQRRWRCTESRELSSETGEGSSKASVGGAGPPAPLPLPSCRAEPAGSGLTPCSVVVKVVGSRSVTSAGDWPRSSL